MKIRITAEIKAVDEKHRPVVGEIYPAKIVNAPRGVRYDIEVGGRHTMIFPHECEIVKKGR